MRSRGGGLEEEGAEGGDGWRVGQGADVQGGASTYLFFAPTPKSLNPHGPLLYKFPTDLLFVCACACVCVGGGGGGGGEGKQTSMNRSVMT